MRGSWRAGLNPAEPTPEQAEPERPKKLSSEELQIWKSIMQQLSEMKVLTTVDGWQLERYAKLFARWRVKELIAAQGKTLKQREKAEAASLMLDDKLRKIEDRFGLNPSSRSRIRIEQSSKLDVGTKYFRNAK
jgi:P27 family predicted phage terminase small subunit